MSVISALRRLRQNDQEFEVSLGYKVSPCLSMNKSNLIIIIILDF
jgi:hypothetical protein